MLFVQKPSFIVTTHDTVVLLIYVFYTCEIEQFPSFNLNQEEMD